MDLLEMSFSGAVFIIAVVIIRTVAINHLPKKMFLVLWEMVLLRLIIPFSIPCIFSVYTLIDHNITTPLFSGAEMGGIGTAISSKYLFIEQGMEQISKNSPSVSVWFLVWCVGMIFFATVFGLSYLRCRLEFRTALPVSNAYAEQWLRERALKRRIAIRQSDRIAAPLTYGIFHPIILMPKKTDWENVSQLQYIFSHEYVHIYRFDSFKKLIAAVVLCVHWFNPFVWVMYLLFNRDVELACDERVIRQFGEEAKSAYSRMLIRMEAQKSGLLPFCSSFSKNAVEERITAIMNTKRMSFASFMSACFIVFVTVSLFGTSAIASSNRGDNDTIIVRAPQKSGEDIATDQKRSMSITYESADILYYEDGCPYIHDVLTNNTAQTIIETQYGILAYDKNGSPLKLYWNFLDNSAESSFENLVRTKEYLLSDQTEDYRGGWSLYDGEIMTDFPKVGNGGANQAAYSLFCLKQVVFEDGTVWDNPDYESWLMTYAGKEVGVDELQDYYPYEYEIDLD